MIIHVNEMYLLLDYGVAITLSIITALLLGIPFIQERPRRGSWTKSALFPTPIIAIGLLAIFLSQGLLWIYNGLVLAVIFGVSSGLFVRYLFDYLFPKPETEN